MTRRLFIAGNWKLNLGPAAAAELASGLKSALADRGDIEVGVFPTALSIAAVRPALAGSGIHLGIQNVHTEVKGAWTGANSVEMAREAGCTHCLVGHSERRHVFGETHAETNAKVKLAFEAGLVPVLCIGETLEERRAGRVDEVVHGQLAAGLADLGAYQVAAMVLAYEPVWAIGTGETASPEQAQEVHASIRAWLRAHYPAYVADELRIQYGGSVKPSNARELLSQPDIDGALVGGAALKVDSFKGIVDAVKGL